MADLVPIPARGEVFLDARGADRALRVSWHHESGLVVLSLWRGATCSSTFRLAQSEVPDLVSALVSGLQEGYDVAARSGSGPACGAVRRTPRADAS